MSARLQLWFRLWWNRSRVVEHLPLIAVMASAAAVITGVVLMWAAL